MSLFPNKRSKSIISWWGWWNWSR